MRFTALLHHIYNRETQLHAITEYGGNIGRQLNLRGNAAPEKLVAGQSQHFSDDFINTQPLHLRWRLFQQRANTRNDDTHFSFAIVNHSGGIAGQEHPVCSRRERVQTTADRIPGEGVRFLVVSFDKKYGEHPIDYVESTPTQAVGIARTNECERIPVVANAPHRDRARDLSRKPQGTRVLD